MNVTRRKTRCVVAGDVALADGRVLRIATLHEPGTATLILAVGEGEGRAWREDPSEGIVLPVAVVPGLLAALSRVRTETG